MGKENELQPLVTFLQLFFFPQPFSVTNRETQGAVRGESASKNSTLHSHLSRAAFLKNLSSLN